MRYQSALVLSTLAVGQAAASSGLRHASFHKRHDVKRDAQDVDWNNVALDLSGVDWSKVDYGNGAASSAAPAAPAPTPASSEPEVVATPAAAEPSQEASTPASEPASSSSKDEAPAESTPASSGGSASGILDGIDAIVTALGAKVGLNDKAANKEMWIGDGGKHSATFTNSADKEATVYCWGKATMWINANQPVISIKLGAGETQKISAADGFSGGCGAAFKDSDLFMGLLNESILEFTFGAGANGCFDISREINMKGIKLTAKGSKCTSGFDGGADACTFICTDSGAARCGEGNGDYDIDVGNSNEFCMVGKDKFTQDPSGGCQMADEGGEHLEVTIHGDRY